MQNSAHLKFNGLQMKGWPVDMNYMKREFICFCVKGLKVIICGSKRTWPEPDAHISSNATIMTSKVREENGVSHQRNDNNKLARFLFSKDKLTSVFKTKMVHS